MKKSATKQRRRDSAFYKKLLTKRALLLEQAGERSAAREIRLAVKNNKPLAVLKVMSKLTGLVLKVRSMPKWSL